ncbi:hypothetical protein V8F06_006089 [Rhypophila decipiens]
MHFFSSPVGTAILMALATGTQAVPAAPVTSVVPKPLPAGTEPQIVAGTALSEAEAALRSVDPESELVFTPVSVGEDGKLVFADSLDKRSYLGSCNSCDIINGNALECNCRNEGGG